MCGRYVHPDEAAMERFWKIDRRNSVAFLTPAFNVSPTSRVPIIVRATGGTLELKDARWGLIPSWWKQAVPPSLTFNARSEEAAEKPTWRMSLQAQRCLLPALGWYEWNEGEPVSTAPGGSNQPYYLFCPGQEVIAFAGLWAIWERKDADPILSCALLSRAAAPSISKIHHRMPAVVQPDLYDAWLDPANGTRDAMTIIDKARTDLKARRVSLKVNNPRNDFRELTDEVAEAAQGTLF